MPDPAGTATPEAPLVVTDRLTGCDVLGAVASQAVNVSASGASHSAPRTRDRSIIRTSPKGDVSTIVPPRVPMGPLRRVRHITSSWADGGVDARAGLGVRRGAERPEAAWRAIRCSANGPPLRNSRASLLKFAALSPPRARDLPCRPGPRAWR